ncbi:MAG: His-Xaa-Ser system radical SAM maturase HxsB [Elusimicrobiota bacterium]|nr:MAG: His-Xaa-Ser system radical SAM maturase HxsB [Elusimicrobiota bacterium]
MSRLTEPAGTLERAPLKVAAHNARRLGTSVLMTNDAGEHAVLSDKDYASYLAGGLENADLARKDFLRDQHDFGHLATRTVERRLLDWKGPNVHTVVVTLRCNFKCLYCHASVVGENAPGKDMTVETARSVVDLIFQSPSPTLMIEFQGGEPLLNWPVVKFIVQYAREKNKHAKRSLHFGLISNFSLLDDEKIEFLIKNGVSFCTSLDGPADLHDGNRIFLGGNGHAGAVAGLKKVMARKASGAKVDTPNAICTVTRASLGRAKDIVDQLVELGLERVQFGPLDPIGFAKKSWGTIGYSPKEFVDFYAAALDYIIALNKKGVKVYEKMGLIFMVRVLEGGHWRFPNADGVARLAYNHDGGVYTCEEGRLLANEGDEFFKIGDASSSTFQDLLDHPTVHASLLAASPEAQPLCSQCAYSPFCTVLPVYNQQTQGSVFGRMPDNGWCEKMMGIFDVVFTRLQDPESRKVLESWLEYKSR